MASPSRGADALQEILEQVRTMSNNFEKLRQDVDILKGNPPSPARSSSGEPSSSSSSSESEGAEGGGEESSREGSRSRANLTRHRMPSREGRGHHSRSHRSRSRSRARKQRRKRSHSPSKARRASKRRASRSRSRPPTKRPKKKSWADRMEAGDEDPMDYNAPLTWPDSEEEEYPNLQEVSEETRRILETSCLSRKSNTARLQVRNSYPLPKVAATRSLALDSYLKPELSSTVKQEDKELAKIQAFILDALAPLTTILEETGGDQESGVYLAAKAAVQLVGNANAKMSHLRRKKVVSGLNSALMPLVEEDKNFTKAPPSLFGTEFAQKSKDHVDQVKAIRAIPKLQRSQQRETFFRGGPPSGRGGGRSSGYRQGRGGASYRPHSSHNNRQFRRNPAGTQGGRNLQNSK